MIDQVLLYNRLFVAQKRYEPFLTNKYPDMKLAVLSCMDTRLSVLLQEALGLKNGDAKIIKNAGGIIPTPYDSTMRSLVVAVYELGVKEVMVVHHSQCGACHMCYAHLREEMLQRGIAQATLDSIEADGIDLTAWLEGFHDTEASVRQTVAAIREHPLMPRDLKVRGFIIDSETGALTEIH